MIDQLAIGLSGLCIVHCLFSALFLAMVAAAGGLLFSPIIHEAGLSLAISLGILAFGRGIFVHRSMLPAAIGGLGLGMMAGALSLQHGSGEAIYTVAGVTILALGHMLNRRAAQ